MLKEREIDVTPLFDKIGLRTQRSIQITEGPKMYPFKTDGDIRQNWSYFMTYGFMELKRKMKRERVNPPESIGIVGIGNGIEGIVAAKIFRSSLKRLFVIDTDEEILDGALENIKRNVTARKRKRLDIIGLQGSFAEPLEAEKVRLDLIAGNVPNLPSEQDQALKTGEDLGTFMPRGLYEKYAPPEKFVQWALGAQYAFLTSSAKALRRGGSALTLVGGRFPLSLTQELFEEAGFRKSDELIAGYKEQTEPAPDFAGYAKFEDAFDEVSFDFYPHTSAIDMLEDAGITHPTRMQTGARLKEILHNQRQSARQALAAYKSHNTAFGHSVHLLRGVK